MLTKTSDKVDFDLETRKLPAIPLNQNSIAVGIADVQSLERGDER
jgi:hypothetical protein